MSNVHHIAAALADLELQVVSNYKTITKKYRIIYTILIKQYIRKTISNHKAITEH